MSLYNYPKYYEIAFSFRDIAKEVDVFEECIRLYSKIPVRRMLEIGCGHAPHLEELAKRGYSYVGIDVADPMIHHVLKKASDLRIKVTVMKEDMRTFSLETPVDFVFVMLGSLYVKTTQDIMDHFHSVARALRPGGLYFLDWCINFQWGEPLKGDTWTVEKDGVNLTVKYVEEKILDRAAQIHENKLTADITDPEVLHLEDIEINRTIFPQEFLLLVERSGEFEFIGWWNNWNLEEPVEKAVRIERPITVIRRL